MGCPILLKVLEIHLELVKNVVIWQIVLFELLNDNHDKKIEHDKLHDDVEADEKEVGIWRPTRVCSVNTLYGLHAVKHYQVPIFSC